MWRRQSATLFIGYLNFMTEFLESLEANIASMLILSSKLTGLFSVIQRIYLKTRLIRKLLIVMLWTFGEGGGGKANRSYICTKCGNTGHDSIRCQLPIEPIWKHKKLR